MIFLGHFVENVTAKSPADKAGLRAGDRILEINGVNKIVWIVFLVLELLIY